MQKIKINELNPAEYNARKIDDKELAKLKKSIEEFGLVEPLVVNKDMTVIGGHQRLKVCKELGWEEINCIVVDLDKTKEKLLNLALNRISGEWDEEKLGLIFKDMDLDIADLSGFDADEISKSLDFNIEPEEDDFDAGGKYDAIKEPESKLGEVYELGEHRLMCGDATKIEDVEKLMDGQKADVVVTDPPYNTGMQAKGGSTWLSHMFNDVIENWEEFLVDTFTSYIAYTKGECAFYVFIDWRRVADIKHEMEKHMDVKNVIVWDKQVHGLGSDYKFTYELCIVGKKGKPEISNRFGKDYQDVWHVQRAMGRNEDHATAKPIELIEKPIKHASKEDDIVLDLFGGSGSTLIAAEKLNRKCYMMELDPKYCDVIRKRYEQYIDK